MLLGENIKRLRKERGWSQKKLAEKIGAHLTHINRVETGKYSPSIDTVAKLAKVFGISIDYLVNNDQRSEEFKIEDQSFAEKIKLLDTLDEEERFVVAKIIDAILIKKKTMKLL